MSSFNCQKDRIKLKAITKKILYTKCGNTDFKAAAMVSRGRRKSGGKVERAHTDKATLRSEGKKQEAGIK